MQIDPKGKKYLLINWIIWLLSIAACIFLVAIVHQNIKIQSLQKNLADIGTVAHADSGQGEPVTVNQQADYEKTIQQLQGHLKDLQTAGDQDPGAGRAGAIPPPDGSIDGGQNVDKGIIAKSYKALLKRLELSSEESEEFIKFLTERRQAWIEIEDEITNVAQSENDVETLKKELEDSAWEYNKKARELLGEKNYQKYNEYNSSLGIFMTNPVDEFKTELVAEEEINKFQEEQLVSAMAEEFEEFISSTVPNVKGPPGFRVGMSDEKVVSKIADGLSRLQEGYLASASSILTDSQMKKFENIIKTKIAEREMFFKYTKTRDFEN